MAFLQGKLEAVESEPGRGCFQLRYVGADPGPGQDWQLRLLLEHVLQLAEVRLLGGGVIGPQEAVVRFSVTYEAAADQPDSLGAVLEIEGQEGRLDAGTLAEEDGFLLSPALGVLLPAPNLGCRDVFLAAP